MTLAGTVGGSIVSPQIEFSKGFRMHWESAAPELTARWQPVDTSEGGPRPRFLVRFWKVGPNIAVLGIFCSFGRLRMEMIALARTTTHERS